MIYSGKSIEEAIKLAEDDLKVSRNELCYTIIKEKKSFFLGSEVTIEITKVRTKGTIAINDGKILYTSGDIKPSLEPGPNISITVNGNIVNSKTYINEQDEIKIEPVNTSSKRFIGLKVSEDKMEAVLTIEYEPQREYKIFDKAADNEIIAEALLVSEVYPPKFTMEEIQRVIDENNIKFGVQSDQINSIIKGGSCIIARGKLAENPVDDKIVYFFSLESEKKPVEVDGKVDYYNMGEVEYVERNTILAEREEGVDGKNGLDIYGNKISAPSRKKLILLKGTGCDIVENGNKAISLIKGMPGLKNNRICVYETHFVDGDVDIKTGNVQFNGDIVVRGNVNEGMKVWSGNNITVTGEVTNADLTASGNVKIQNNVISSTLKAGDRQITDMEAINNIKLFERIFNKLSEMYTFIKENKNIPDNASQAQILRVLLQSKFSQSKEKIIKGIEFFKKSREVNDEIARLWRDSLSIYNQIAMGKLMEFEEIVDIVKLLSDFLLKWEISITPADVIINYCQNTNIFATNNVEIRGKGCYNSNISAENMVLFTGYSSVFRGGQIWGGKGIHLKEVGSSAGVVTILKTSKDGVIEANVAYQNTLLYFGELVYRIDYPVKNLKAHVEKSEIIIEKLNL